MTNSTTGQPAFVVRVVVSVIITGAKDQADAADVADATVGIGHTWQTEDGAMATIVGADVTDIVETCA